MANPLDPVMDWYRTASDSIRVTERILNQGIVGAITDKHVFFGEAVTENLTRLEAAKEELQRLVVLALTAIFERTLRDYLLAFMRNALPSGDAQREALQNALLQDIEFWNFSARVLEVFPQVSPNIRGIARQIIEYRNWVAHGHTLGTPAPSNVTPAHAHQYLTDFLSQAGVLTP
jgi:hypothetical protein